MEKLGKKLQAVTTGMGMPLEVSNRVGVFYDEIDARLLVELDNWDAPPAERKKLDALFSRIEDALNPEGDAEIYPAAIERVANQLALVVNTKFPYEAAAKIDGVLDEVVKEHEIEGIPATRTHWGLGG